MTTIVAESAAMAGRRRIHLRARSQRATGRAAIGSPPSQ
jgi:hypothetical protein